MKALGVTVTACGWIMRVVGLFLLWTLWLGLTLLLGLQVYLAIVREYSVPDWAIRRLETELASRGVRAKIGRNRFEPGGRILLEDVELSTPAFEDPLATVKVVNLRLDPWQLAIGRFEPAELEASGLNLFVPAMLSPTGSAEPVARDFDLALAPSHGLIEIKTLSGWLGNIAVTVHGRIQPIDTRRGRRLGTEELIGRAVQAYVKGARQAAELGPWLAQLNTPQIDVALAPDPKYIALASVRLSAPAVHLDPQFSHFGEPVDFEAIRAAAVVPLTGDRSFVVRLSAEIQRVRSPQAELHAVDLRLPIACDPTALSAKPGDLDASIASVATAAGAIDDVTARIGLASLPRLSAEANARFAGENWTVRGAGDLNARRGDAKIEGRLSPPFFDLISRRAGVDLNALLAFATPPRVAATAEFGPDWTLIHASGQFSTGALLAHRVPLDEVSGKFSLRGTQLEVRDVLLRQGENLARGIYSMDTKSNDYRILLTGRLRPVGIAGWFGEWWPHFWSHFDFSAAPPEADVDVLGRWGAPEVSTVFVSVDAKAPEIQTVKFDRVRTTLFIRPEFYEATEFIAEHASGAARGRFRRSVDLEQDAFRWMDFTVDSTMDLQEGARIFGRDGLEIVEPFSFGQPPELHLNGRLEGPASGRGEHEHVEIGVKSSGPFVFYGFPLSDLTFNGTWHDGDLDLREVAATFASGRMQGHAKLSGREPNQRLGFDYDLENASLGEAIHTLEVFNAKLHGQPPPQLSKFQQRLAEGRFGLRMSADGRYRDPLSYVGNGNAELVGAELAEINLLGALSQLLRRSNVLNFTSLRLTTARANFAVNHESLNISELKMTGPTAAVDMKGTYRFDLKQMQFNAKVRPFEEGKTLLANAVGFVLTPLSTVFELKLTGNLESPDWRFVYGPTSLLRTLARKEDLPSKPEEKSEPPPLLRR